VATDNPRQQHQRPRRSRGKEQGIIGAAVVVVGTMGFVVVGAMGLVLVLMLVSGLVLGLVLGLSLVMLVGVVSHGR